MGVWHTRECTCVLVAKVKNEWKLDPPTQRRLRYRTTNRSLVIENHRTGAANEARARIYVYITFSIENGITPDEQFEYKAA